jgi:hypothetical protein
LTALGGEIKAEIFEPRYYRGDRLDFFQNSVLDPGVSLTFKDAKGRAERKKISFGRPAAFGDYRVHLLDFYPRQEGAMGSKTISVSIRRDPAAKLYLAGLALFVLGLALYAADFFLKKDKQIS